MSTFAGPFGHGLVGCDKEVVSPARVHMWLMIGTCDFVTFPQGRSRNGLESSKA